MSVRVTSKVWECSTAKGSTLLVQLALADIADDDGVCFPGVKRLMRKTRLSERAVQDRLAALVAADELERHKRPGSSNIYVVKPGGEHMGQGCRFCGGAGAAPAAPPGAAARTPPPQPAAPITVTDPSQTRQHPDGCAGDDAGAAPLQLLPPPTDQPATAREVVAAWVDGMTSHQGGIHPTRRAVGRVAQEVGQLLAAGWPVARLVAAATAAGAGGWGTIEPQLRAPARGTTGDNRTKLTAAMERARAAEAAR